MEPYVGSSSMQLLVTTPRNYLLSMRAMRIEMQVSCYCSGLITLLGVLDRIRYDHAITHSYNDAEHRADLPVFGLLHSLGPNYQALLRMHSNINLTV